MCISASMLNHTFRYDYLLDKSTASGVCNQHNFMAQVSVVINFMEHIIDHYANTNCQPFFCKFGQRKGSYPKDRTLGGYTYLFQDDLVDKTGDDHMVGNCTYIKVIWGQFQGYLGRPLQCSKQVLGEAIHKLMLSISVTILICINFSFLLCMRFILFSCLPFRYFTTTWTHRRFEAKSGDASGRI